MYTGRGIYIRPLRKPATTAPQSKQTFITFSKSMIKMLDFDTLCFSPPDPSTDAEARLITFAAEELKWYVLTNTNKFTYIGLGYFTQCSGGLSLRT